MVTVIERIGEDYNEWAFLERDDTEQEYYGGGNCIFISAPTGSGKTHFILNVWLKYMAKSQQKILYLVNRSILEADIQERKERMDPRIACFLDVKLYQDIETELKKTENIRGRVEREIDSYDDMRTKYYEYNCVVCDECHYFLTDSNYNTDTSFSFRWIQECFADKVRIFMSATMENIKQYIKAYDYKREFNSGKDKYYLLDIEPNEQCEENRKWNGWLNQTKFYYYDIDREYDYLNVRIMYDIPHGSGKVDGIVKMIEEQDILKVNGAKEEKWLIFVDNINMGEQLEKKLGTDKAVFISSRNRREKDKAEVIDDISINEKTKKRFVIATSVLDNGINLKDIELRNVILGADTETEFIQMLGRKRRDQKNLNVYIYPRNRQHFENRLSAALKKVKIANEYLRDLINYRNKKPDYYKEDMAIECLHIQMMRKMADNNISIEDVRSLFNVYGGILYLNLLAYQNIQNLNEYYKKVIEKFDECGEDAFVKIQLDWLGIKDEKADRIIADSKESKLDMCREKVIDSIKEILNKPLSKEENIEFKVGIKKELECLVMATKDKGDKEYNSVNNNLKKNDRSLSNTVMDYLYKYYGIPYIVTCENGMYTFSERNKPETIGEKEE